MKILLLNPNTSESLTTRLLAAAVQVVGPDTQILPATAPRGVPYISTRAEAQIGGAIALEMLAERAGSYDAAVIAAFGDPGLFAARELFEVPAIIPMWAVVLSLSLTAGAGLLFGIYPAARASKLDPVEAMRTE